MQTLAADLRYALRVVWQNPRFSLAAIAALTLGIGANAAIFSVVNAVLLRPLSFPEPDRLVQVGRQYPDGVGYSVSIPKFMTWKDASAFEAIAAYDFAGPGMNLGSGDRPEQVRGIHASAGYFQVFGARMHRGRPFTQEEDAPGGPRVVVLSHRVWTARFGADPAVVGRSIVLNGDPHVVVGILDRSFEVDPAVDVFVPLQADPNSTNQGHYLEVAARLAPGVSLEQARAEAQALGEQFRRRHPEWMSERESVGVIPMQERVVGDVRPALFILLGAVGLVLLIACANVASLLLARAAGRQKEVAIRAAIGASRWSIIRQLLTESVLLAAIGAAAGLLLGIWGVRALLAVSPADLPRAGELSQLPLLSALLDARLLAFTLAIAVLTGVIFGAAPALHLARTDLGVTLKEGGGRSSSGRASRTRGLLVIAEIALALVLLVGAALLIRTFAGLRAVEPGFAPRNVLTLQTSLAGSKYTTSAEVERLTREVTQRIDALPGVVASAAAISIPTEGGPDLPFIVEGRPLQGDARYHGNEHYRTVSAGYFEVLSIPLVRGRLFTDRDLGGSAPVVIINAAMARQHWPEGDAVGQRINIGRGLGPEFEDVTREIVGIVGDVRDEGVERPAPGIMYVPNGQAPDGLTRLGNAVVPTSWLVRATFNPSSLAPQIQKEFLAVDPLLPIARVRTMEDVMSESIARQSFNMRLLAIFGGIALLLAAIGIYGLMSYSVEQAAHDIGVRLALGADRRDIFLLVVGRGMRLAAIGLVLGVAGALAAMRLLSGLLFGVTATDPVTFTTVVGVLGLIALAACYLPARRAMAVDPLVAVRGQVP